MEKNHFERIGLTFNDSNDNHAFRIEKIPDH